MTPTAKVPQSLESITLLYGLTEIQRSAASYNARFSIMTAHSAADCEFVIKLRYHGKRKTLTLTTKVINLSSQSSVIEVELPYTDLKGGQHSILAYTALKTKPGVRHALAKYELKVTALD